MATFNKFSCFKNDVGLKIHDLNSDVLKIYLSNDPPAAGDTVYNANGGVANGPEDLATGGNYTAGGEDAQNTWAAGVLAGVDIVWTAVGATIGPLQYAILYNFTAAGKNLIGWWDKGAPVTASIGETITADFGATILDIT